MEPWSFSFKRSSLRDCYEKKMRGLLNQYLQEYEHGHQVKYGSSGVGYQQCYGHTVALVKVHAHNHTHYGKYSMAGGKQGRE